MNARLAAGDFGSDALGSTAVMAAVAEAEPRTRDPGDVASWGKVGRNEACPCGSGRKYKHCHGALV